MVEELFAEENEIILIVLCAILLLVLMAITLMIFFNFARNKIIQKEQEKARLIIEHQKNILQATIETQEEERKRIAKDLHDDISAKLNVVSLNTNVLLEGGLEEYGIKQTLKHILNVTNKVLKSSRDIAHNLLPPVLEKFGLQEAVEELAEEFCATNFEVSYTISYKTALSKTNELHVFRIIQELLNNSVKHGKATQAHIELKIDDKKKELIYTDNGKGFNVAEALQKKGLGLNNIQSRVEILQGSLVMESPKSGGVLFKVKF